MTTAARPDAPIVARWFHALADETRVQIVEMLSHKERCVCELEQVLEVAQSRLSFHLKVLKDAGLIRSSRGTVDVLRSRARDAGPNRGLHEVREARQTCRQLRPSVL